MRRSILLGVVIATAALFVVPTDSQAQGFGFRVGNVGIGVGRPYYGGFGYGGYGYGGWGYGYPYYGSSYFRSPYYSSFNYGWSPGYSRWYAPSTYYSYSYPSSSIDYYGSSPTTTQSFYQGAQPINQARENAAYLRISVPENAKVLIQDQATTQTGTDRLFYSPPLTPGREFIYTIKATWTDASGKEVTQTREVRVHANDLVNVDLRTGSDSTSAYQPADNAKPAPADNPNANYRGAPVIERGEQGATPPNTTTLQQPSQQVPARQPATTNTTNVIAPAVIGGVGPAPAVGNVPAGANVTPGSNVPNTVPSGTTSTPGAATTPTGTSPIGPALPNAPTSTPVAPAAPPTNR